MGIETELARKINKDIRDQKFKVQGADRGREAPRLRAGAR